VWANIRGIDVKLDQTRRSGPGFWKLRNSSCATTISAKPHSKQNNKIGEYKDASRARRRMCN
jgi:hypothetical protein